MVFSPPHHHFFPNFGLDLQPSTPASENLAMWCEELALPYLRPDDYDHAAAVSVPNIVMPPKSSTVQSSPGSMSTSNYPERLGLSKTAACFLPATEDFRSISGTEHNYYYYDHVLEGEYCCSDQLVSNFWPASAYPHVSTTGTFFEVKDHGRRWAAAEDQEAEVKTVMKVGKYSAEERKDKIMKYVKKRNQRNFNKTIKYACRKTLADKRVRVRGRFAKNSSTSISDHEPSHEVAADHHHHHHEETLIQKNNTTMYYCRPNAHCDEQPDHHHQFLSFNNCHVLQDYPDHQENNEDWLQEAMATLMYSPH